jgi:hypothetical protein
MNIHFPLFMVLLSLFHGEEVSMHSSSTVRTAEYRSVDFSPDESISGIFFNNPASVQGKLGDLMPLLDREASLPFVYVLSYDSKQYLKMVFHPGDVEGSRYQEERS